jgi:hypothetical protein
VTSSVPREWIDGWKGIAAALGRSDRWCQSMAVRTDDRLPVFKVGGIVRLKRSDLVAWLARQETNRPGPRQRPAADGSP